MIYIIMNWEYKVLVDFSIKFLNFWLLFMGLGDSRPIDDSDALMVYTYDGMAQLV
jgi:hypothetical protein